MINEALKEIRILKQIKKREMSYMLGISLTHLSEIESSKCSVSDELLERYSEHFDIDVSSIMMFSSEKSDKRSVMRIKWAGRIIKLMKWANKAPPFKVKM